MRREVALGREEVVGLACNGEVVLAWTREGRVLGWGEERESVGVMGMGEVRKCDQPTPVPCLSHITRISLSVSHAAAVDGNCHSDLGRLFTWGTGPYGQLGTSPISDQRFKPGVVESARIFKAKEVACGEHFTAVCTTGGYVYMYGVMGRHIHGPHTSSRLLSRLQANQSLSLRGLSAPRSKGHENRPYTFPDGPSYFMTGVAAGRDILAVLTEDGRVMVVDECLEMVRMEAGDRVQGVRIVGNTVLGLGSDRLYQWKEPLIPANQSLVLHTLISNGKSPCSLRLCTAQAFAVDSAAGQVQLVQNNSSLAEEGLVLVENSGDWQWREIGGNEDNLPQSLSKLLFQQLKSSQHVAISGLFGLLSVPIRSSFLQLRSYRSSGSLSLPIGPIHLLSSLFRLRISRLSNAWGCLRTHQTIQKMTQNQAETQTKQRQIQGLKRLLKAIQTAETRQIRQESEQFFLLYGEWGRWRKRTHSALQIVKRYGNRYEERLKKRSWQQWSNWVIRCYISVKGVASLVITLSHHLQARFFLRLQSFSAQFRVKIMRLCAVLRHFAQKSAQIARIRTLTHWKGLIIGHKAAKAGHMELLQAGIRSLSVRLKGLIKRIRYRPAFQEIKAYGERKSKGKSMKIRIYCLVSVLNKVKFRVVSGIWRGLKLGERGETGKLAGIVLGRVADKRKRWGVEAIRRNWMNIQIPRVFPLVLILSKAQDRLLRLHSRLFFSPPITPVIHDFYPLTPTKSPLFPAKTYRNEEEKDRKQLGSLFVFDRWSNMGDKKEYYCPMEEKGYIRCMCKGDSNSSPTELSPVTSPSLSSSSSGFLTCKTSPNPRSSLASSISSSSSRRLQYSQSLKQRQLKTAQKKTLKAHLFSTIRKSGRKDLIQAVGSLYQQRMRWGFEGVRREESRGRERAFTLVSQSSSGISSPPLLRSVSDEDIALERTWKERMQRVATERVRRTLIRREKRVGWTALQGNRGK